MGYPCRNDTLLYIRYYADNYEEVHAGDTIYRYYYVYTPDGLSMIAERIGNTMNLKLYSVDTNGKTYYFQGNKITKDQYDIYSEWGYECSINETHLDFSPGDRQMQGNLFLINRIHSGLHTNIGGQTTQEVYFQDYFLRFFLFSNF